MRNTDSGKIVALMKSGWDTEKIAADMHMEPQEVDKVVSEYMGAEKKKTITNQPSKSDEQMEQSTMVHITSGQLKNIYEKAAAIGAKEALKMFQQEREKEQRKRADRRLRNTKLLLRNYHMLKEHTENSVFGRTQMEESAIDILESMMSVYDNDVIIESIKRSATRTAIIVSHIEVMFGLYHSYCEHTTNREIDLRRYEVTWDMYMAEKTLTAKEIAEKQNISTRNVYEDIRIAVERLSALIFGVDGLKVH